MTLQSRLVRLVAAALTVITALALTVTPASAGSRSSYRSSGSYASVQWVEFGDFSAFGIAGNVHLGHLWIDASSKEPLVFGSVIDFTCPPGEQPHWWGDGIEDDEPEPPSEDDCVHEDFRWLHSGPGEVTFTMSKKFDTARLEGQLQAFSDHSTGAPVVDMTLTGIGSIFTSRERVTYTDGGSSYIASFSSSSRQAVVTGRLGPMRFDDDADDQSSGQMGTYRDASRSTTR